jgi:hypothetical protein
VRSLHRDAPAGEAAPVLCQAREDADDVPIDHGERQDVGNAANGGSGVGSDAGHFEPFGAVWNALILYTTARR